MNIYLVGMSGSGKSALGRALAKKRNLKFLDTDQEITRRFGKSAELIIKKEGEEILRQKEAEMMNMILDQENLLVSTGGGFPIFNENMKRMNENGITIYLSYTPDVLWKRLQKSHRRPLVSSRNDLVELLEKRKEIYEEAHNIYFGKYSFRENLIELDRMISHITAKI